MSVQARHDGGKDRDGNCRDRDTVLHSSGPQWMHESGELACNPHWADQRLNPWIEVENQCKGWQLLDSSHNHQGKRNSYRNLIPPLTLL